MVQNRETSTTALIGRFNRIRVLVAGLCLIGILSQSEGSEGSLNPNDFAGSDSDRIQAAVKRQETKLVWFEFLEGVPVLCRAATTGCWIGLF